VVGVAGLGAPGGIRTPRPSAWKGDGRKDNLFDHLMVNSMLGEPPFFQATDCVIFGYAHSRTAT
jgi:hypothetical protein